jgi:hypothetical protein
MMHKASKIRTVDLASRESFWVRTEVLENTIRVKSEGDKRTRHEVKKNVFRDEPGGRRWRKRQGTRWSDRQETRHFARLLKVREWQ